MLQKNDQFNLPTHLDFTSQDYEQVSSQYKENKEQWSPYEINGGNVIAYAQDDIVVFGADTRISRGYTILHREVTKIHRLTDETYILTAGMYADALNLWKKLDQQIELYKLNYGKTLSSKSIASLLSRILYEKRFFPFYTFNIIVGNDNGKATSWGYDAVGSYQQCHFNAAGSALEMLTSHTGVVFGQYNNIKKVEKRSPEEIVDMIIDIFNGVAERDTTTGDFLELKVLKGNKIVGSKKVPLRKD